MVAQYTRISSTSGTAADRASTWGVLVIGSTRFVWLGEG